MARERRHSSGKAQFSFLFFFLLLSFVRLGYCIISAYVEMKKDCWLAEAERAPAQRKERLQHRNPIARQPEPQALLG